MTATGSTTGTTAPLTTFGRVLVGVDGSAESDEAVRQARALAEGDLILLAVYDTAPAVVSTTGTNPPASLDEDLQREAAENALRHARTTLGAEHATGLVVRGCSWEELGREVTRGQLTLVAVGSHGTGRLRGIVLGSTATELVHGAPCSVLVARKSGHDFPRSIVVGVDGSPESATAYVEARRLAERVGATLRTIVARGGKGVDAALAETIAGPDRRDAASDPVAALVDVSDDADLLVLGSRGLHGLKALGSVSERVAHEARCSVLIVRKPAWQRVAEELGRS